MKNTFQRTRIRALMVISALLCGAAVAPAQEVIARYQLIYTGGAQDAKGGRDQIRAAMRNGRNRTNEARRASRTDTALQIATFHRVNFNDRASGRTIGDAFNALRDGSLSGQRNSERNTNSDLAIITSDASRDGIRGRGNLPGPYSVGHVDFIQRHIQLHESGHNYNGIHGQAHRITPSGSSERFTGIRSGVSTFRLSRILNRYSNPNVRYQGIPLSCCGRNNAGRIRAQRNTRANRR